MSLGLASLAVAMLPLPRARDRNEVIFPFPIANKFAHDLSYLTGKGRAAIIRRSV